MHKTTVRELIEELQRQDPDAIVQFYAPEVYVDGLSPEREFHFRRFYPTSCRKEILGNLKRASVITIHNEN